MKKDRTEKQISIDIELKSNTLSQLSEEDRESFTTNVNVKKQQSLKNNLNRKYPSHDRNQGIQITNEEFNKFLNPFFLGIDYELYKCITQQSEEIELIVNNKIMLKNKNKKLKYLRRSLYSCYILEKELFLADKNIQLNDKEEINIDGLDEEIIKFFIEHNSIYYKNFPVRDETLIEHYKNQKTTNNKRKKEFKVVLDKKLEEVAYFSFLNSLESDIENIFVTKIRNKKIKKKEGLENEIKKKIELINEFKNDFRNVVHIENKFIEPMDLFNLDGNEKEFEFFGDTNEYF
ncbi:hypothetical protein H311_02326 [Anncaliia algerae PRA109]|nr:hypothetical protein H311_02326 [Anncaliia algerae PRA109]